MKNENPYNAYILIKQNPEDKDYFAIINGKATFLKGIKSDKKYIVADVHITKDMGKAQIGEAVHFYTLETLTKEDLLNYDVSKSCLCSYAEKDTFTTFKKLKDFEGYFCDNKIFFKTESGVYYFSVNEFVGSFRHASLYDNSFEEKTLEVENYYYHSIETITTLETIEGIDYSIETTGYYKNSWDGFLKVLEIKKTIVSKKNFIGNFIGYIRYSECYATQNIYNFPAVNGWKNFDSFSDTNSKVKFDKTLEKKNLSSGAVLKYPASYKVEESNGVFFATLLEIFENFVETE